MSLLSDDSGRCSLRGSRNYFSVIYLLQNLFAAPRSANMFNSAFLEEEVQGSAKSANKLSFIWSCICEGESEER